MSIKYKYKNAHEWLLDFLSRKETDIYQECAALVPLIDTDEIQNLYQDEMDKDGYFEPITEVNNEK